MSGPGRRGLAGSSTGERVDALLALYDSATSLSERERAGLEAAAFRGGALARNLDARPPRWRVAILRGAVGVSVVCMLGLPLAIWRIATEPVERSPLVYSIEGSGFGGAAAAPETPIGPPAGRRATVRFSDGSTLSLASGSTGRVVATSASGARVAVDDGRATMRVVHKPDTRWFVEAGPFEVAVTGTSFDVSWSAKRERFTLDLHEGSVVIDGPLTHGLGVTAGHRVVADVAANTIVLTSSSLPADDDVEAPPPAEARNDAHATRRSRSRGRASTSAPTPTSAVAPATTLPPSDWPRALAQGRFADIVVGARELGLTGVIERESALALGALADAARYTRDAETAQLCYDAIIRRNPGSGEAERSEFFLGWAAERQGELSKALARYDSYVARHPSGPYAEKAQGRATLIARQVGGDRDAARRARAYLSRFPGGAYAAAARNLAGDP